MATTSACWTADDLDLLPDYGNRYEVIAGELFVTPAPRRDHQALAGELSAQLRAFAKAEHIGRVFLAPGDVHFNTKNRVQPDIFVEPRSLAGPPKNWRDGPAPILVVEFLSDSTAERDLGINVACTAAHASRSTGLSTVRTGRFASYAEMNPTSSPAIVSSGALRARMAR